MYSVKTPLHRDMITRVYKSHDVGSSRQNKWPIRFMTILFESDGGEQDV